MAVSGVRVHGILLSVLRVQCDTVLLLGDTEVAAVGAPHLLFLWRLCVVHKEACSCSSVRFPCAL